MMKNKINLLLGLALLVLIALACNVQGDGDSLTLTSARISDLKFGRNREANPPSDTFNSKDQIFIRATIANTSGKHKVKFRLWYDDVKGKKSGELLEDIGETDFDLSGDGSPFIEVSRKSGIDVGRYKAEAILLDEEGKKEIDRKVGTFNVVGSARE